MACYEDGFKKNGVFCDVMPCGWRIIPEDTILHSHCRENLKSYKMVLVLLISFEGEIANKYLEVH
jgi:hypothetical protein